MKKNNVTTEDLSEIFEELYLLRTSKISEKEALQILSENQEKKSVRHFLNRLSLSPSFIDGLTEFPKLVPKYIIETLKNNPEISVLKDVAEHLISLSLSEDNNISFNKNIKHSFAYPVFLFVFCFLFMNIMLIFIIPVFEDLFRGFGAELPALTQMVIDISEWLQTAWWKILAVLCFLILGFELEFAAKFKSRLILMLPSIGKLARYTETFIVLKTLHFLLEHRFNLKDALRLSASATNNSVISEALLQSADDMEKQQSFITRLEKQAVFFQKTIHILKIFEKTGNIELLQHFAKKCAKKVYQQNHFSSRATGAFLLVFCAFIIGLVIIAMYLPVFMIGSVIG